MELNKNFLLIGILFLILPNISALIINEIMYDLSGSDSDREWIEIYNDESIALNLTGWKFFEGGTNHLLSLISGSFILNPGDYAIIAENDVQFSSDNPGFNGANLFDSYFSLSNSGETFAIKNNSLEIINSITYSSNNGANGDGNSLQFCNGIWKGTSPTPGSANLCAEEINNNNNNSNSNSSEEQKNESNIPTIEVNYPPEVSLNKEFIFKIKLINFNQDIYDVKIEIFSNGARIAEIMNNNQWKSTTYYLNDIINSNGEKEFIMRVVKEFENAEIIIKIKNSNEKIETFQGYNLSRNNEETNETYNGTASEIIYLNASLTNQQNSQNEDNEINISNTNSDSKDIKSGENTTKLNKSNYARYILTAFVFLLALLFLLKKIFKKKYQNEFKN